MTRTVTSESEQAVLPGMRARIIAAPGYDCDAFVDVIEVSGRSLTARLVSAPDSTETYTLRKNGKWSRSGSGQWANYLRFAG